MSKPFDDKRWIISGFSWGAIMFLLMTFVFPLWDGDPITMKSIVVGLIIWTITGLGFGYTMKISMRKLEQNEKNAMK